LRGRYEALLEQQTQRFTDALQQGRPALDHTRRRGGPAAGRGTQFAVAAPVPGCGPRTARRWWCALGGCGGCVGEGWALVWGPGGSFG
jgi:hypothetical protein